MNYKQLLAKATPYYERGRSGDIEHIRWIAKTAPAFIPKNLDKDTVMAVIILHDTGYSCVPKNANPFDLSIRRKHMQESAKIAKKILIELGWKQEKIDAIAEHIAHHDDWAFGDDFSDNSVLAFFSNFDFMWMASKEGFDIVRRFRNQTPEEFYSYIIESEEKNEQQGRKWQSPAIEQLYKKLLKERKEEL